MGCGTSQQFPAVASVTQITVSPVSMTAETTNELRAIRRTEQEALDTLTGSLRFQDIKRKLHDMVQESTLDVRYEMLVDQILMYHYLRSSRGPVKLAHFNAGEYAVVIISVASGEYFYIYRWCEGDQRWRAIQGDRFAVRTSKPSDNFDELLLQVFSKLPTGSEIYELPELSFLQLAAWDIYLLMKRAKAF